MSKKKKYSKELKVTENLSPDKVMMVFTEDKYYNDLEAPIFRKGETYEVEGADWIQRWVKRGGVIVKGDFPVTQNPDPANPSSLVGEEPPAPQDPSEDPQGDEQTDDNAPPSGESGEETETDPSTEK